jgi:hypothetical protein
MEIVTDLGQYCGLLDKPALRARGAEAATGDAGRGGRNRTKCDSHHSPGGGDVRWS